MDACADQVSSRSPVPAEHQEGWTAPRPSPPALLPDAEAALFTPASRRPQLVAAYPELAQTCAELQFGDALTLGQWCSAPAWPLLRLARAARPPRPPASGAALPAGIGALLADIQRNHHRPLRNELNRLGVLIDELVLRHPLAGLGALGEAFARFKRGMETHLLYEEHLVFPRIRRIDEVLRDHLPYAFLANSMTGGVRSMMAGHDVGLAGVAEVRRLAGDAAFLVQDDDVEAVRAGLAALQADLAVHAWKEDDVLVPAAIAAEEQLQAKRGNGQGIRNRPVLI